VNDRQLDESLAGIRREARDGADREVLARRLDDLLADLGRRLDRLHRLRDEARSLAEDLRGRESGTPGLEPSGPDPRPRLRQDRLGASTFIEKGWHLISRGDYPAAIQALHRALDLAPLETQAAALLGWAQMLEERHDEAMATFARVLERDPDNELARVNVGFICLRKRIFGEAIEHLSRVIREGVDRKAVLYAHYYLGLVYLERGMHDDAIPFLARAVELGPNLIEARYELGRALWFAERRVEARAAWTQGAEAGSFSPWAERCRDALRRASDWEGPPRSSFG
jgi:tetratricopeptide (TPR) repeat protein